MEIKGKTIGTGKPLLCVPVMESNKEEIIDEYLNRQGLQEIKKMLYHPGYIPNTDFRGL